MKTIHIVSIILVLSISFACSNKDQKEEVILKPYSDERAAIIGRGAVALLKDDNTVFLNWRLLPDDSENTSFDIYRKNDTIGDQGYKIIGQTDQTFYVDDNVRKNGKYSYSIRPKNKGSGETAKKYSSTAINIVGNSLVFDTGTNYKQARVVTGDLNGDGELEVVIAYSKNRGIDPYKKAWKKSTDTIKVASFLYTGERLWEIDLGWGIEAGVVYSPIIVWDIDSDGRAEVILKTNKSEDPLNYYEQYLSVLDGETGSIIMETQWPTGDGLEGNEDKKYNSNSRNYLAIAHLDGENINIIAARGCYNAQKIWAYDNKLNRVWERVLGQDLNNPIRNRWLKKIRLHKIWDLFYNDKSRASHSLPIADVNEDGAEEILWGEHSIGNGGKDLWVIKERMPYRGHPDIVFAADILPSLKGKEIFYCREGWGGKMDNIGMLLTDSQGKTIWSKWGYGHVDGGWVAKVIPKQAGLQLYGYDIEKKIIKGSKMKRTNIRGFLWNKDGKIIRNPDSSWVSSFPVDWDGDGIKEICEKNGKIKRYDETVVADLQMKAIWGADLFGDYREEIVTAPKDGKIYIFFNSDNKMISPAITRLADRQYRNDLSRTAMGWALYPTEGGYIPTKLP